ncbi:hypothetical protein Cfor_05628, partial [Coptotermes formosanus]
VSVGASVFTITAMSIDRYMAIRHPMAFRKIFNRSTTLFIKTESVRCRAECNQELKARMCPFTTILISCKDN